MVLQIAVVVICKTTCLVLMIFIIVPFYCLYFLVTVSNDGLEAEETEQYLGYVVLSKKDTKLSKYILRNTLRSITYRINSSEKKELKNLLKRLNETSGFSREYDFDNDQVPPFC